MSVSNDIEWTKKGCTGTCLHNAKEVPAFATQIQARTLVLPGGPRQNIRGGTQIPTNLKENEILSQQMVDMFKCHTSHPIFPATESSPLGQLRKGGRNNHFIGTIENEKILIKTILASSFRCLDNRSCQWSVAENQVLTPRRAEDEEQNDLDPEQLTLITLEQRNMPQARGDSESFRTGIICQNGGKWTTLH